MSGGHLAGRVAVVSGVARPPGIGRAVALRLARAGAHLVCADVLSAAPADSTGGADSVLFDEVVGEVRAVASGEVVGARQGDDRGWSEAVDVALTRFGRIDICCALNGATGAEFGNGPLVDITPAAWQRCLALNLTASFELMTAAARAMRAGGRPGAIVALSSHAATTPAAGVGALGAARSAVEHLVTVLAQELGEFGIRCNAVSPLAVVPSGQFPNPGLLAFAERAAGSLEAWLAKGVPLRRGQAADETAAVIEFLISDAASFVSGVTVPVAGGAP